MRSARLLAFESGEDEGDHVLALRVDLVRDAGSGKAGGCQAWTAGDAAARGGNGHAGDAIHDTIKCAAIVLA
jgi:hypothetical protein